MAVIPVYTFTGFLDSGKTKFIQETLEDPRFNAGEKTLICMFEDGEEEYDISKYPFPNVYVEDLDQETVTEEELAELAEKYRAQRVILECNGMQNVGDIYRKLPEDWEIAQEVMFADSTTFLTYNANMRNLVMDKMMGAEMIVFNRLTKGQDTMPFHKIARAANRNVDILYDYTDGTTEYDDIVDPLPFDINAPVIDVKDQDYALWYRDCCEEPDKYDGKTVKFKAQVAMLRSHRDKMFAPGRFVMTCCEADIEFCGVPCNYERSKELKQRSWVMVEATIAAEAHDLYGGGVGPILTAISVEPAEPAQPDVATF